jgi:hypothetical protein
MARAGAFWLQGDKICATYSAIKSRKPRIGKEDRRGQAVHCMWVVAFRWLYPASKAVYGVGGGALRDGGEGAEK